LAVFYSYFLTHFSYDFVSVRDGRTTDSPLVGRYCGHTLPPNYLSQGNELLIRFKSDHSVSHEGFSISYRTGLYYNQMLAIFLQYIINGNYFQLVEAHSLMTMVSLRLHTIPIHIRLVVSVIT
jgi:hypothetical protein